jgi:response regulator RpfG family c-di-GMP phosphodiesterase
MPDLIICDLMMPEMDGIAFIKKIKQIPELKHIPVIASSAFVFTQDRENSLAAGADGFLGKPVDGNLLTELLQDILQLEWDYEEKTGNQAECPDPRCCPPEEMLKTFYAQAKRGDISQIRNLLKQMETCGQSFGLFREKLKSLADEFRVEDIARMMEQYMKSSRGNNP